MCFLLSILIICPLEFAACSKGQYDPVFIVDERPVLFEAYSPPMNLMRTLGNGLFIDSHLLWVKIEGKTQRFSRLSYIFGIVISANIDVWASLLILIIAHGSSLIVQRSF